MSMYAVSACLIGISCRYDGGHSRLEPLYDLWRQGRVVALCPEVLGGLATPRPPCEIREGRVISTLGADCTAAYARGAEEAVRQALRCGCTAAVLQSRSPSCGVGQVYDGTFTRTLVGGDGVWAHMLRRAGIAVYDKNAVSDLLKK